MKTRTRSFLTPHHLLPLTVAALLLNSQALLAQTQDASTLNPKRAVTAGGEKRQEKFFLDGHTDTVFCVQFSPDGTQLATASADNTVKVWDAKSGVELRTLKGHTRGVNWITFSPDGRRIASASNDETVRVWDAANGQLLLTLKQPGRESSSLYTVAFSPDGKKLAMGGRSLTLMMWDASSGQQLFNTDIHYDILNGCIDHIKFSPDGKRLAFQSLLISQWVKFADSSNGKIVSTLYADNHKIDSFSGLAFSLDSKRLLTANRDLNVWDASSSSLKKSLAD